MTIINTVMAFAIATLFFGIGLGIYALWLVIKEKKEESDYG